ncbi:MAG: HAD hydrolase-like protein [Alphaproteobacteria bacterium]
MTTKPKAVLFDWDNTLAQTRNAVVETIEKVLKAYNKEPWAVTKAKYRDGTKSFKENFPNFFGENAKQAYEDYLNDYNPNSVTPTEGSLEFLEFCQKENIEIYIISNKEKSLLLNEVKACFSDTPFLGIYGNGETKNNKPAADPVFLALKNATFEINKENVWLVGDSKQDTECAFNANILPVLISKGLFMDNDYIKSKKNNMLVFNSFRELLEFIKRGKNE